MKNINEVIEWIELNQIEWFTVSTTKSDNTKVFDSLDDETLDNRKKRFRDTMRICTGGRFVIKGKRNKSDGRGLFEAEFENQTDNAPHSAIGSSTPTIVAGVPKDEVQALIASALKADRTDRELAELRIANKQLTKEVEDNGGTVVRMIGKIEPFIDMFLNRFIPTAAVKVALGDSQAIQNEDVSTIGDMADVDPVMMDRIQAAVEKRNDADPDFVQVLEFIAEFAASGATISPFPMVTLDYNAIKSMLK
jgi:hypothetical protein